MKELQSRSHTDGVAAESRRHHRSVIKNQFAQKVIVIPIAKVHRHAMIMKKQKEFTMRSNASAMVKIGSTCKRSMWLVTLVMIGFGFSAIAQEQKPVDKWASYSFLLGEWIGEGSGQPGRGEGGSTFALELNNNILIRKSYNNIPAAENRPAVNHEDMMVIYQEPQAPAHAIYWDNEGHTIAYGVEFSSDGKILTFLSDARPDAPRFKLTYENLAVDTLKVSFEFAPPGKPDEFSMYTSGIMYRR